jgi:hypothetical protein
MDAQTMSSLVSWEANKTASSPGSIKVSEEETKTKEKPKTKTSSSSKIFWSCNA